MTTQSSLMDTIIPELGEVDAQMTNYGANTTEPSAASELVAVAQDSLTESETYISDNDKIEFHRSDISDLVKPDIMTELITESSCNSHKMEKSDDQIVVLPDVAVVMNTNPMIYPVPDLVYSAQVTTNKTVPKNLVKNLPIEPKKICANTPDVKAAKESLVPDIVLPVPSNTRTTEELPSFGNRKRKLEAISRVSDVQALPDIVTSTFTSRTPDISSQSSCVPPCQEQTSSTAALQAWRSTGRSLKTIADNLCRESQQPRRGSAPSTTSAMLQLGSNVASARFTSLLSGPAAGQQDQVDGSQSTTTSRRSPARTTTFTELSVSVLFNFALYVTIRKLQNVIM